MNKAGMPDGPDIAIEESLRLCTGKDRPDAATAQILQPPDARQPDSERGCDGKLLSSSSRRRCVAHFKKNMDASEGRACRVLGHPRSTQRFKPAPDSCERDLTKDILELASRYDRYGYRRITALLRERGWAVNHKRVERIWRRERLKVPQRQPRRRRLWLNDGSCVRLRPHMPNHVWAYDFYL